VTGLLTAFELDRRGCATLVLERGTLCSGQTGQCHGWLHRGGIFPDASAEHVDRLDRGARRWMEMIAGLGAAGPVLGCDVGGLTEETLDAVTAAWQRLGLTHRRVGTGGAGCAWLVESPERAIVPLTALQAIIAGSTVILRTAEAVSLLPGRRTSRAEALLIRAGQRMFRLYADAFVLANGSGITSVLPDSDLASRITSRLSFMLVVRSSQVGDRGFAVPAQEALGLFGVPRADGRHQYLLISNFLSYALTADVTYSRLNWLAGIRPTLERFLLDVWKDDDALWGIYPAIKVEPTRPIALGVSSMALLTTRFENVCAGVPGKLVLAPLLAERLADAVAPYVRQSVGCPPPLALVHGLPAAQWGPEEWEVTPLVRRATLFDEGGCP